MFASFGICALAISTCLCLVLLDGRNLEKAQFGVAQREGEKTRKLLDRHAKQVEQDLRLRLDAVLVRVDNLTNKADAQLTGARADIRSGISDSLARVDDIRVTLQDAVNKADNRIQSLDDKLTPILTNAASITAAVEPKEVAGAIRDTRFLLARSARTVGHVEQMADTIETVVKTEVPPTSKAIRVAAQDLGGAVHQAVQPKPWYKKIPDYLSVGGKIILYFVR
jgi:hypothetical protein